MDFTKNVRSWGVQEVGNNYCQVAFAESLIQLPPAYMNTGRGSRVSSPPMVAFTGEQMYTRPSTKWAVTFAIGRFVLVTVVGYFALNCSSDRKGGVLASDPAACGAGLVSGCCGDPKFFSTASAVTTGGLEVLGAKMESKF